MSRLAYWIIYSFIMLMDMVLESLIYWSVQTDDLIHDLGLMPSLFLLGIAICFCVNN